MTKKTPEQKLAHYKQKQQEYAEKAMLRRGEKLRKSMPWLVSEIKEYADQKFWCSTHLCCFRFSVADTEEHIYKCFDRFYHHLKLGRMVYSELRLKEGMGRPDLVVIEPSTGEVWCEEIVVSESGESIKAKEQKYPWPVTVVT